LDGITQTPAVCLQSLGNTLLRPERSSELEGGFDADFWHNRLSLTVSQYNKTRHDAILSVPVAPSVYSFGDVASIQTNIGVIRNMGTEITAVATILENASVRWAMNGMLSRNTNQVVRLNKGQSTIVLNGQGINSIQTRVEAGYPLFAVFARPIVAYGDANHNGVIEPTEIRYAD